MGQTASHIAPRGRVLGSAPGAEYFGALDGFRGLLALLVAIYHTAWGSQLNNTAFLNQGAVIIDLFFVFSGFLMFTLYGRRMQTGADAKKFLWRRFARLYPVHFVMTMVFLAFAFVRLLAHKYGLSTLEAGEILPFQPGATESLYSLMTNLSLTQAMGLHDSLTFNPPAWTISVEFFAYFVFAAMLIWLPPTKTRHFVLIGLCIAAIYALLARVKPDMNITYDWAFWRCLGGFYTGVIGAEIYRRLKASDVGVGAVTAKSHLLEALTLGAFVAFVIYLPGKMQFFVAPFALLFVIVFAFDRGFISSVMMAKPFVFLARISYSVYMVHVIIAIAADIFASVFLSRVFGERWHDVGFNGDIYLVPYIIGVIIAGYLLQRFVEAPAAKWLGRLGKSQSAQAKPAIA
jgi:peptidoglycan/LPS O-acetylase OafA/YrhL